MSNELNTLPAKLEEYMPKFENEDELNTAVGISMSNMEKGTRMIMQSYIEIGYYLKQIRDDQVQSIGSNVYDYAEEHYGLDRSQTFRYMQINDKYSVDGNSVQIDLRYSYYNKSQLIELLNVPEEQMDEFNSDMTIKQMRDVKRDLRNSTEHDDKEQDEENTDFKISFEDDVLENNHLEDSIEMSLVDENSDPEQVADDDVVESLELLCKEDKSEDKEQQLEEQKQSEYLKNEEVETSQETQMEQNVELRFSSDDEIEEFVENYKYNFTFFAELDSVGERYYSLSVHDVDIMIREVYRLNGYTGESGYECVEYFIVPNGTNLFDTKNKANRLAVCKYLKQFMYDDGQQFLNGGECNNGTKIKD